MHAIASKVNAAFIALFANELLWVRASLGALLVSGLGLPILVALVTSRTFDVVDDGGMAKHLGTSIIESNGFANWSDSAFTIANGAPDARDLREAIDELTAKGLPDEQSAEPEGKTAAPSPIAPRALVDETSSIATERSDKSGSPRKPVQRRAKSVAQRDSSSKYHQVPKGTEKMFDANWQSKAFAYIE